MVSKPEQWIEAFAKAGANSITFHIEATENPKQLIDTIRGYNMNASIAIKPKTNLSQILPLVPDLDMVLIMTVEPGFGGQEFMEDVVPKVKELRDKYPSLNIQVDGGINEQTISIVAKAGANVIVSGSGIFKSKDPKSTISYFRQTVSNFNSKSS